LTSGRSADKCDWSHVNLLQAGLVAVSVEQCNTVQSHRSETLLSLQSSQSR